jgi:hypothetical protein
MSEGVLIDHGEAPGGERNEISLRRYEIQTDAGSHRVEFDSEGRLMSVSVPDRNLRATRVTDGSPVR